MTTPSAIGVIGAGAWGTALAHIWAQAGHEVTLWARRDDVVDTINAAHTNPALPSVTLVPSLRATNDYALIDVCDIVVYALPAQVLRAHLTAHPIKPHQTLVIAAKGIEIATGDLLPAIATALCPGIRVAVLSGPNIALEVAQGLPAASTIACLDEKVLTQLQSCLSTKFFRLYPTTDVTGVSCGGALKNVIIMASGIVDGMKLGENARAAVLTRGLAEMVRLAVALGGNRETLMGLSGIGDMFLKTRNYRFGLALADGNAHDLHADTTVEGISTAQAAVELAGRLNIEMPICVATAACVNGQLSPTQAVEILLQRPARKDERE